MIPSLAVVNHSNSSYLRLAIFLLVFHQSCQFAGSKFSHSSCSWRVQFPNQLMLPCYNLGRSRPWDGTQLLILRGQRIVWQFSLRTNLYILTYSRESSNPSSNSDSHLDGDSFRLLQIISDVKLLAWLWLCGIVNQNGWIRRQYFLLVSLLLHS